MLEYSNSFPEKLYSMRFRCLIHHTKPDSFLMSWFNDADCRLLIVGRSTYDLLGSAGSLSSWNYFLSFSGNENIFPFSELAIQRVTTAAHQMVLSRTTNVDDNDEILKTYWFLLLRLSTWSYTTSYWCCVFCEHSFVASLTVKFCADEDYKVMENREKMIEKGVLNAKKKKWWKVSNHIKIWDMKRIYFYCNKGARVTSCGFIISQFSQFSLLISSPLPWQPPQSSRLSSPIAFSFRYKDLTWKVYRLKESKIENKK